jgi:glycosyltransferase involved in cell wall biosynthesis
MKISVYSTQVLSTPPQGYGGLENIQYLLARYLSERGHAVNLFATSDSYNPPNGTLFSVAKSGQMDELQAWRAFWANEQSRNALKESDIVCDASWLWSPYSVHTELKHLCHVIHAPDPGFDPKNKPPMSKPNIMAVGFNQAKSLMRQTGLEVRGVQNGVDTAKYTFNGKPIAERERLLWVSRVFFPKGAHRAIKIAENLKMPIDVVGGSFGDNQAYVQQIKDMCSKSEYAKFHGEVSFDKKVEFYRNAKCVVLPIIEYERTADGRELNWLEPWGLIISEAGSCGTPTIVTPNGGFNESLVHGVNGFFANADSEFQHYVAQIDELKPEKCRMIAEMHDYKIMGDSYMKLFESMVNRGESW